MQRGCYFIKVIAGTSIALLFSRLLVEASEVIPCWAQGCLLTGGLSEHAVAGKLRVRHKSKTWQVEAARGSGGVPFPFNKICLLFYEYVPVVAVYQQAV